MASTLIVRIIGQPACFGLGDVAVVDVAEGHELFAEPGNLVDADVALVGAADHRGAHLRVGRRLREHVGAGNIWVPATAPAVTAVRFRKLRR